MHKVTGELFEYENPEELQKALLGNSSIIEVSVEDYKNLRKKTKKARCEWAAKERARKRRRKG